MSGNESSFCFGETWVAGRWLGSSGQGMARSGGQGGRYQGGGRGLHLWVEFRLRRVLSRSWVLRISTGGRPGLVTTDFSLLTGCTFTEENFTLKCPKHKVGEQAPCPARGEGGAQAGS